MSSSRNIDVERQIALHFSTNAALVLSPDIVGLPNRSGMFLWGVFVFFSFSLSRKEPAFPKRRPRSFRSVSRYLISISLFLSLVSLLSQSISRSFLAIVAISPFRIIDSGQNHPSFAHQSKPPIAVGEISPPNSLVQTISAAALRLAG